MSEERTTSDPARSALLVIDVQPDFLPGGTLPTHGGDEILAPLAGFLERSPFGLVVATQDWHPPDHVSFASNHAGREPMDRIELHGHEQVLWPDHCVQGSAGARLHPDLPWDRAAAIVRKGTDPRVDSYSGFRNNWNPAGRRPPTGLAGYLRERGVDSVFVAGLARDYCVKWSAEDAGDAGFTTWVLWDLTRPVDPESDADVRAELEAKGVRVLLSGEVGD